MFNLKPVMNMNVVLINSVPKGEDRIVGNHANSFYNIFPEELFDK